MVMIPITVAGTYWESSKPLPYSRKNENIFIPQISLAILLTRINLK